MFAHFGRLLAVLLKFSTMTPEQMLALRRVRGRGSRACRRTRRARASLLFTGHFGFWEINALVHALVLQPMAVLARPLDNPLLHDLLESVRDAHRQLGDLPPRRLRRVLRALAANQAVAILIDQHIATADAVYVDFFNRPAATTSALAALALRTGAPVDSGVRAAAAGRPLPHGLRARGRSAGGRRPRTRSASSRSAAPTCSRCTCAAIPTCGSGCTGAGATWPASDAVGGMFPAATRDDAEERATALTSRVVEVRAPNWLGDRASWRCRRWAAVRRGVVRAPNWLGDAVMALPALGARACFEEDDRRRRLPAIAPMFAEHAARPTRPDADASASRTPPAEVVDAIAAAAELVPAGVDGAPRGDPPSAGATAGGRGAGC